MSELSGAFGRQRSGPAARLALDQVGMVLTLGRGGEHAQVSAAAFGADSGLIDDLGGALGGHGTSLAHVLRRPKSTLNRPQPGLGYKGQEFAA